VRGSSSQPITHKSVLPAQIIVLDKLDYCATLRNLESVKDHKNMKVRIATPPPAPLGSSPPRLLCCQLHMYSNASRVREQPAGGGACPSAQKPRQPCREAVQLLQCLTILCDCRGPKAA